MSSKLIKEETKKEKKTSLFKVIMTKVFLFLLFLFIGLIFSFCLINKVYATENTGRLTITFEDNEYKDIILEKEITSNKIINDFVKGEDFLKVMNKYN